MSRGGRTSSGVRRPWIRRRNRSMTMPLPPKVAADDRTIKSVAISVSASGDNTIVPAVSGKRIKVVAYTLQAVGTVNAKWRDGSSADLTGQFNFQAREGISPAASPPGWLFGTSAGNALVLNLSGAI